MTVKCTWLWVCKLLKFNKQKKKKKPNKNRKCYIMLGKEKDQINVLFAFDEVAGCSSIISCKKNQRHSLQLKFKFSLYLRLVSYI